MNFGVMMRILVLLLVIPAFTSFGQTLQRRYDVPVTVDGVLLPNPWAGGMNSCQLSTIDLDGDGLKDLFFFDRIGNRILTFLNTSGTPGEALYTYTMEYNAAFPTGLKNWCFLRDFNCDGKEDIVSNSQSGMKIWFNTSSGGELSFEIQNGGALINANYDFGNNAFDAPVYTIGPDLPAFADHDGDGDTDIITFSETSVTMYYFKSMQVENGDCSTLDFICGNRCYGMFNESAESFDLFMGDAFECDFNVEDPRGDDGAPLRHTGGTVLTLDLDQNGMRDIVLGDVTETNLVALLMEDSQDGLDSAAVGFPDFPAPFQSAPAVDMTLFPGAFYEDVDNDGVRDLVVCPNAIAEAEDQQSVWWYRNNGANDLPDFEFVQEDFLQEGMIDLGHHAYPVVFDLDNDGLKDLLVANGSFFDPDAEFTSRIQWFRNTGSATAPAFALQDPNWLDIPSREWKTPYPAFGDLDGDGDADLIIGEQNGFVHFFRNTAMTGEAAVFELAEEMMADGTGTAIDVGQFAAPQLLDFDGDGLNDLMIGEKGGNINYYHNDGTAGEASFTLVEDTIGDVVATNLLGIFGYSVPHFFLNPEGDWELLIGSETGQVNHYTDLEDNISGDFTLVTTDYADINEGQRCAVFLADMTNDGTSDLFIGQVGGGVGLYTADEDDGVEEQKATQGMRAWPNPAAGTCTIDFGPAWDGLLIVRVFDVTGRVVDTFRPASRTIQVDVSAWGTGVYTLEALSSADRRVIRLVVR